MNFKIRKLMDDIIELLNGSDVPIEAKRLIIENLAHKLSDEGAKVIAGEIAQAKIKEEGKNGSQVNQNHQQ